MTEAAAQSDFQIIPLKQLKASPLNVRKTGGKKVDDLAASIRTTGLQQNLGVVANDSGKGYDVVFGGRRLRALQALSKADELPAELADGIPCRVMTAAEAQEASLAENTIREAMHPLDQFTAFQALVDEGKTTAEVAARFGVSELVVRQRMRLARVSPKLLQAYGAGAMALDQLQAYAVIDDPARQEQHWKTNRGSEYQTRPDTIRRELAREQVSSEDGRVKLVGLEAYQAAGGQLAKDLFSDAAFVLDVPLLERLAGEVLEKIAEIYRADGWAWVEVGGERPDWNAPCIVGDEDAEPSVEDAAEFARLEKLTAMTPEEWAWWGMFEEAQFTAEEKARSGVRVTLTAHGSCLVVYPGLLRDGEAPPEGADDADGGEDDLGPANTAQPPAPIQAQEKQPGDLSFSAQQRLQAEATAIIQLQVANSPHISMALLVAQLAMDLYSADARWRSGHRQVVFIGDQPGRVSHPYRQLVEESPRGDALADLAGGWRKRLPAEPSNLAGWLIEQTPEFVQQLLAFLVARKIDAVNAPHSGTERHATAVELAALTGTDLAAGAHGWQPTEDWLETLPKAAVVQLVTDARGEKTAAPLTKLKKDQVAAQALPLFPDRWLPPVLRPATPERHEKKQQPKGKAAAAGDA